MKKSLRTGTVYTINETNSAFINEKFYDGYTSEGWGKTDFGILLGNNFFGINYFSVDKWVKA